jgi:hypothetical protein
MRCWFVYFLLAVVAGNLSLAAPPPSPPTFAAEKPITVRSQSGQFVVSGLPMGSPLRSWSTSTVQYVRLDPNLTAVSLESHPTGHPVGTCLAGAMAWNDYRKHATVAGRGRTRDDHRAALRDGWGYRIAFPEIVDKDRFLHATVKTILLEFANRRAHVREAEIPPWLVEGLAAVLSTSMPVLALEPAAEINQRERIPDPLASVREALRRRGPLSLDDLSLPEMEWEQLTGENVLHFRACAHLFVHELLRLRDGRACLRQMLERLPENLNWQTTFLESFQPHFSRLLDIDQWYALHAAGVAAGIGPHRVSRQRDTAAVDEILGTPVEVPYRRAGIADAPGNDAAPPRFRMGLFPSTCGVGGEDSTLASLEGRASGDLVSLINDYRTALIQYVGSNRLRLPATERNGPGCARVEPLRTCLVAWPFWMRDAPRPPPPPSPNSSKLYCPGDRCPA